MEFPIRSGFEVNNLEHGIQIDWAIDVRKKFGCKVRAGIPAQFRGQTLRINYQQYQAMLTGKNKVGYAQNLVRFRAMNEALACQRFSRILSACLRVGPGGPGCGVEDEFGHGFTS
jgi:hypothetical protein